MSSLQPSRGLGSRLLARSGPNQSKWHHFCYVQPRVHVLDQVERGEYREYDAYFAVAYMYNHFMSTR